MGTANSFLGIIVKAGIIKDDSFDCIELQLRGDYDKVNPRTEIVVIDIEDLPFVEK